MLLTAEIQAVDIVVRAVTQEAVAETEALQVRHTTAVAIIIQALATVIRHQADITVVRAVHHRIIAVVPRHHEVTTAVLAVHTLHLEAIIVVQAVVTTVLLRVVTAVLVDIPVLRQVRHLIREVVDITDRKIKQPLCLASGVTVFLLLKFVDINKKIIKK